MKRCSQIFREQKKQSRRRACGFVAISAKQSNQQGQATIEYALLIGIAALIGLAFLSIFSGVVGEGMLTFNVILEQELVSGGFNEAATGWEN